MLAPGNNGTIDGQGSVWWENFSSHSLNYSRPHIVEFISSNDIIISNLTFLNSPAWNIHPVYCRYSFHVPQLHFRITSVVFDLITSCTSFLWKQCSNVWVQNITAYAPPESPRTSGVVPGLLKEKKKKWNYSFTLLLSMPFVQIRSFNIRILQVISLS